jgi:hypothetical protein
MSEQRLINALNGKSLSAGGLNAKELKKVLADKAGVNISTFTNKSRKEVEKWGKEYLKQHKESDLEEDIEDFSDTETFSTEEDIEDFSDIENYPESEDESQYRKLSSKEKSYCRCVAHVAKKNAERSPRATAKDWKYNPYAVCRSSVKPPSRNGTIKCSEYYAKEYSLEENGELEAMATLHKKSPSKYREYLNKLK